MARVFTNRINNCSGYVSSCGDVTTQKCLTVDQEECNFSPGPDVCETVYDEECSKVPHEDCQVVQQEECDKPTYHAPVYRQYKPQCRTVDKRVCNTIYIDKCVKTPREECTPGEPIK